MVRPHYITRRVGDEYVLVRVDPVRHIGRWFAGAVGTSLLGRGLSHGGVGGILLAGVGAGLLYHAFTGRDPLDIVCGKSKPKQGEEKYCPSLHGHAVLTADSGERAWEQMQQSPPDAVVVDQRLPRMSGIELLQRMRQTPALSKVAAVLCSGDDSERDAAKSAGADFWLKGSDG